MPDNTRLLNIHDWEKNQSYRKDRGAPPWIKVHRNLFSSQKWACLTDAEKGQLVSLWILAADSNGVLTHEPKLLQKMAMLDDAPNINKFIKLGLIENSVCQHDANMTSDRRQHDAPETETETELNISKDIFIPDGKIFIEMVLNTKEMYPIYETDIQEWESLYLAVDVRQELRNMCGWLNANPEKRKTKRGIKRFINSWLSKTQDKGNGNGSYKQISTAQRIDAAIYGCLEEYDSEAGNVFDHE